jgi:hypothetical protein
MTVALIGLAFGIGYAYANLHRRAMPLSLAEVLLGGLFGLAANADEAADALPVGDSD